MQYSHLQTCKIKSAVLTLSKAKCLSHLCKMHNFGTQREDTHNCMKTWILLLKWEAYYILQLQWCCKGPREEKGNTCHPKISHPCELACLIIKSSTTFVGTGSTCVRSFWLIVFFLPTLGTLACPCQ